MRRMGFAVDLQRSPPAEQTTPEAPRREVNMPKRQPARFAKGAASRSALIWRGSCASQRTRAIRCGAGLAMPLTLWGSGIDAVR
jgi:hypothetical protein